MSRFQLADEEFQPLLKQIYEKNDLEGLINVESERIVVLRSNGKSKKKVAYIKPIQIHKLEQREGYPKGSYFRIIKQTCI